MWGDPMPVVTRKGSASPVVTSNGSVPPVVTRNGSVQSVVTSDDSALPVIASNDFVLPVLCQGHAFGYNKTCVNISNPMVWVCCWLLVCSGGVSWLWCLVVVLWCLCLCWCWCVGLSFACVAALLATMYFTAGKKARE